MKNLKIAQVDFADLAQLREISISTFVDSFGQENAPENMERYINKSFNHERLSAELSNLESTFYFVRLENEVAGYLKINWGEAQTEQIADNALEIERIYVRQLHQGKEIGKALMNQALDVARKREKSIIWLGVWDQNYKAIDFYRRIGFEEFGSHPFYLGSELQTDLLLKRAVLL